MANTDIQSVTKEETTVGMPKEYYIVMHNDDVTPFDFVIEVLMVIYYHDQYMSEDLAQKIHNEGRAIVGMFNKEIAEQKIAETVAVARTAGYPLKVTLEIS